MSFPSADISLRPERPQDEAFLYRVFASTREEELALTNWDEPMRRAFLDHQFQAMRRGYHSMFPAGEFSVIELRGEPVGLMVVNRNNSEIRVVDLALLPSHRNQGIGTHLMRRVCDDAAKASRSVGLSVLKGNRAAAWYVRLGFQHVAEQGFYDEMEWRPNNKTRPAPPD